MLFTEDDALELHQAACEAVRRELTAAETRGVAEVAVGLPAASRELHKIAAFLLTRCRRSMRSA